LAVKKIYENGLLHDSKILKYTKVHVLKSFVHGVQTIEALGTMIKGGYPTAASIQRSLVKGYTNIASILMEIECYTASHPQKVLI
jgi:hypothetical protein